MTIEERVAAMRAGRTTQPQAAPLQKKIHVEQVRQEVAPEQLAKPEGVADMATNTVAKIMDRSDLSDKGKLEAVVDFLNAKDENETATQKNFAAFEAYFTFEQSKRTQVSERNIQRLMDELAANTSATVKHILRDFNLVNVGAGKIKQLLTVMEKARVDGRTVEVLTEAYRANENLLKEIASLKSVLGKQVAQEALGANTHAQLQTEKQDNQHGALNKIFNYFIKDERLSESLYYSEHSLKSIQAKIQQLQRNIGAKEDQRNRKLEDGELTILRTVDATEGGLTEQILQTATDSLALISGMRVSIEGLLSANAKSRQVCADISQTLNSMTWGETILKGALQVVAAEAHDHGESLSQDLKKLAQEKTDAAHDPVALTLLSVQSDKVSQADQQALDYEHTVRTKIVSFQMLASATVQAEARAQQFATLIDSQHEVLSNLQQQALPVTASALEMGLQQAVALRDGLLAAGVRDATKKAQEIFGSSLEGATDAQTRLGAENLNQMREAIAALGKAQAIISRRTDKAIEHGLTSLELVDEVTASAGAVRDAMSDFEKVGAVLATHNANGATVIPEPGTPDSGAPDSGAPDSGALDAQPPLPPVENKGSIPAYGT